jgi:hypothetical protein
MDTDPFENRRRGTRRLRLTTATLGAAAVVGTGALTWAIAAQSGDTATTTATSGTDSGSTSSDTSGSLSSSSGLSSDDGSGSVAASSGGS